MIEHYAVFWNFEENMVFFERMINYAFEKLNLSKVVPIK